MHIKPSQQLKEKMKKINLQLNILSENTNKANKSIYNKNTSENIKDSLNLIENLGIVHKAVNISKTNQNNNLSSQFYNGNRNNNTLHSNKSSYFTNNPNLGIGNNSNINLNSIILKQTKSHKTLIPNNSTSHINSFTIQKNSKTLIKTKTPSSPKTKSKKNSESIQFKHLLDFENIINNNKSNSNKLLSKDEKEFKKEGKNKEKPKIKNEASSNMSSVGFELTTNLTNTMSSHCFYNLPPNQTHSVSNIQTKIKLNKNNIFEMMKKKQNQINLYRKENREGNNNIYIKSNINDIYDSHSHYEIRKNSSQSLVNLQNDIVNYKKREYKSSKQQAQNEYDNLKEKSMPSIYNAKLKENTKKNEKIGIDNNQQGKTNKQINMEVKENKEKNLQFILSPYKVKNKNKSNKVIISLNKPVSKGKNNLNEILIKSVEKKKIKFNEEDKDKEINMIKNSSSSHLSSSMTISNKSRQSKYIKEISQSMIKTEKSIKTNEDKRKMKIKRMVLSAKKNHHPIQKSKTTNNVFTIKSEIRKHFQSNKKKPNTRKQLSLIDKYGLNKHNKNRSKIIKSRQNLKDLLKNISKRNVSPNSHFKEGRAFSNFDHINKNFDLIKLKNNQQDSLVVSFSEEEASNERQDDFNTDDEEKDLRRYIKKKVNIKAYYTDKCEFHEDVGGDMINITKKIIGDVIENLSIEQSGFSNRNLNNIEEIFNNEEMFLKENPVIRYKEYFKINKLRNLDLDDKDQANLYRKLLKHFKTNINFESLPQKHFLKSTSMKFITEDDRQIENQLSNCEIREFRLRSEEDKNVLSKESLIQLTRSHFNSIIKKGFNNKNKMEGLFLFKEGMIRKYNEIIEEEIFRMSKENRIEVENVLFNRNIRNSILEKYLDIYEQMRYKSWREEFIESRLSLYNNFSITNKERNDEYVNLKLKEKSNIYIYSYNLYNDIIYEKNKSSIVNSSFDYKTKNICQNEKLKFIQTSNYINLNIQNDVYNNIHFKKDENPLNITTIELNQRSNSSKISEKSNKRKYFGSKDSQLNNNYQYPYIKRLTKNKSIQNEDGQDADKEEVEEDFPKSYLKCFNKNRSSIRKMKTMEDKLSILVNKKDVLFKIKKKIILRESFIKSALRKKNLQNRIKNTKNINKNDDFERNNYKKRVLSFINKEAFICKTYQLHNDYIKNNFLIDKLRFFIKTVNSLKFKEIYDKNQINLEDKDIEGNSLLNLSAKCSANDIAVFLINEGANIHTYNKKNNTPLHYSLLSNNYFLSDLLIQKKADEHFLNFKGMNPWQYAYHVRDLKEMNY